MTDRFRMLGPEQGLILLPTLADQIMPPGEEALSLVDADEIVRRADERLAKGNAELAVLEAKVEEDTAKWNPYPNLDDDDETPAEKLQDKIYREEEKRTRAFRRSARLPVQVVDPRGEGISLSQQAAIDHVLAEEPAFAKAILDQVFAAYQGFGEYDYLELSPAEHPDQLAGSFELTDMAISRWDEGPAFVHIRVRAEWEDDHGLYVIYRQGQKAKWATGDEVFDEVAGDPQASKEWETREKDPAFKLYSDAGDAAMEGDLKKLRNLVEKGVNLNYDFEDGYSPLWHAIDEYNAEIVRFLLESGADPKRREDGKTALGTAREKFQELSWLEKPQGLLMKGAALFAKVAGKSKLATRELQSLKEIIHMLEERTGLPKTKF